MYPINNVVSSNLGKKKLSNENYPFLNDNSSAVMFDETNSPIVRILIPRRDSKSYPSCYAYMVELHVKKELKDF